MASLNPVKVSMKIVIVMLLATIMEVMAQPQTTVNFDSAPVGTAPDGWTATQTGSGNAKWAIEKDDTAPSKSNVLKQSGAATYPICFKNDTNLRDGFVEVKFKPIPAKKTKPAD